MQTKICSKCKKERPISKFCKSKNRKDGLDCTCKSCKKKYQQQPYVKISCRINSRKHLFKKRYNLTFKQHEQMYTDQDGRCIICRNLLPYDKIHTDHNHKTGKVRGLLCRSCNYGLHFIEDKDFVKKAKKYLKDHQE